MKSTARHGMSYHGLVDMKLEPIIFSTAGSSGYDRHGILNLGDFEAFEAHAPEFSNVKIAVFICPSCCFIAARERA